MKTSVVAKAVLHRSQLAKQRVLLVVLFFAALSGCTISHTQISIAKDVPQFIDDGDPVSLIQALRQQQHFVRHQSKPLKLGQRIYTAAMLEESLAAFAEIMERDISASEQDRLIKKHFTVFQADGRSTSKDKEVLVTGYFEPVLEGSLTRDPPYLYPLYAAPADLRTQTDVNGGKKYGRIVPEDGNVFRPYWTRREIDGSTILQGNELVYLKNRFDAFLLHVQGSGKIKLQDGETRSIRYAANNGHPYSSIGKLLVDEKKLTLSEASIPKIREYLRNNPGEMTRVLNHNRRYIFFAWTTENSPRGSSGAALTPERSVAIDREVLPMKTVAFLLTQRPVFAENGNIRGWQPMHRFVFPQDTGAAIKGSGRVDLFWGSGDFAEKAAGSMKQQGKLYFLIKKDIGEHL